MKTVYYSELTNKYYNNMEEAEAAENAAIKKKDEEKCAEEAVKDAVRSYKNALTALDKSLDKYFEVSGKPGFEEERYMARRGKQLAELLDWLGV